MTPSSLPSTRIASPARPVPGSFGEARVRVLESLRRLGVSGSTDRLRACVPEELAGACGFTRAMISAVCGSRWVPLHLYTQEDLDPAATDFRAYVASGAEIPLANLLAETEMVRRRTAVLVPPPLIGTRAFRPIIEVARSPAYVAAPLVIKGRTVGFLHADRVGQSTVVDEGDRRLVRAFADGLAVVYERICWEEWLGERARLATAEMRRAATSLQRLERPAEAVTPLAAAAPPETGPLPPARRIRNPLTAREWEVLEHVADGATNLVVAHRLTLSEETVKTHMRNVLRKLGVSTRSAAVAWYLEIGRSGR
jgi:LuxR family transcriptional regulator, regulator of acetate metabolism